MQPPQIFLLLEPDRRQNIGHRAIMKIDRFQFVRLLRKYRKLPEQSLYRISRNLRQNQRRNYGCRIRSGKRRSRRVPDFIAIPVPDDLLIKRDSCTAFKKVRDSMYTYLRSSRKCPFYLQKILISMPFYRSTIRRAAECVLDDTLDVSRTAATGWLFKGVEFLLKIV